MGEIKAIIDAYRENLKANKNMALVTVLRVRGSSYRQPGARMLINEDGEMVGTVSGGCLERDLIRQAQQAFQENAVETFKMIRYDTTEDGDDFERLESVSLGCQGEIDLSLEILMPGRSHSVLEALCESRLSEKTFTLATMVSAPKGFPILPGHYFFEPPIHMGSELREKMQVDLKESKKTASRNYFLDDFGDEPINFLLEKISPPKRLIIFGAGHDSIPLATLGKFIGWHVTIVDCHSAYTMPQRFFSNIDTFIKCEPADISSRLQLDQSVCTVVTHNYYHDIVILKQLLQADVSYIGLMGPKTKGQTMLDELKKENPDFPMPSLIHLHSPAGIDSGAEDPHQVALSIITEALSVVSGRQGGFLKIRQGPIHERGKI
jgi:xanthine dehydrogenase accessory factor